MDSSNRKHIYEELKEIMSRLRDPDNGCPWDLKQTHESLIPYLEEESGEVIETINNEDMSALKEELGDLFLQILFHSQLATEEGEFTIDDCLHSIRDKLIHRHPHIFNETGKLASADAVHKQWNQIKEEEKFSKISGLGHKHPMDESLKLQELVCDLGFEFDKVEEVRDKIFEELRELEEAPESEQEMEAGDLIFSVINYLRFRKINPKKALRCSMNKFRTRFDLIREELKKRGKFVHQISKKKLNILWEEKKTTP